ncbi:heme-binding protein [Phenylobacterium sp.]|uniref:heme-binding protein n=1 Tax=Phenylobacterium sp. TaxID=1871053 RepID=UPI002C22EF9E|nr:heme-binding protein [Phenylobacterium sp.]HLZ73664.1 heme-binding protein [Phenylobacterium sp.]
MKRGPFGTFLACAAALALGACGGGGGGGAASTPTNPTPPVVTAGPYALPGAESLSVADVQQVIAQAVNEAKARNTPAVIAVTDRVGNVLAVYSMTGARATATIRPGPGGNLDVQGVVVPAAAAAISKAITGAYLSSAGQAFSTRTASMIVQEHFPPAPASAGLEGGPLFGVQFSSLPCSDLVARFSPAGGTGALIGPKRAPLGLAADPGGFPLYKNGVLVGGVGVMSDGDYAFDPDVSNIDNDDEENVALAATNGFAPPATITADKVALAGTTLRYSDATSATLKVSPTSAPAFAALPAGTGTLTAVTGYYPGGAVLAGQIFGQEASGVRQASSAEFSVPGGFVLSNGAGQNRYPPKAGTDAEVGTPLSAAEVTALLEEAFKVMDHARGAIRQPADSTAQMSIAVTDTHGVILGLVRAPDASVFGTDVAVQKARSATFFSGASAASDLLADPSADVRGFVQKTRDFFPDPAALTGKTAFGMRSIGNLARPFFPDGQQGRPNGPLSRPISQWSIFSTGLQSALILTNLGQHLQYVTGASASDTAPRCTFLPDATPGQNRLQNGLQIFPGGVPIYRSGKLVGGIGVSGDGIDQDDMVAFLGVFNASSRVGISEAPAAIRADQLVVGPAPAQRLLYVNCPFAPFLDTQDQNVCQGK